MSRTRRRLLFLLWVPLASVLLLEGVLQLGARLLEPPPSPIPPRGADLLAVGDSWVAGAEAPVGEGFVDVLERRLTDRAGRAVGVINAGRTGANSAHVALTVLDLVPALRPAWILVLVGQNNATNAYRVAEVEELLASRAGTAPPPSPGPSLRTLKLARILWANLRGTEGYREAITAPPDPLPAIPALRRDVAGAPVLQAPLLADGPGRQYLERQIEEAPTSTGDPIVDAAWTLLFACARRTVAPGAEPQILQGVTGPHAVLARYALLRRARELGDWRRVAEHGQALLALPRGALRDLGAAEGALLAGDWRRARALLTSAAHRAPGFADVLDLACRFPSAAADRAVQEACEADPWGAITALDRARMLDGRLDPEGAAQARRDWLATAPHDLGTRVDLAIHTAHVGDLEAADALMGLPPGADPLPEPVRPTADHWRYYVLRSAEPGDRDLARAAVDRVLADPDAADAALLGAVASVLSEFRFCEDLPDVATAWFRLRRDPVGFGQVLQPCMSRGDIATLLASLQPADAPLRMIDALGRSARAPFALLERDLDLVLDAAAAAGSRVLLLDYPNPSEDHAVLATILGDYAAARGVPLLPLRAAFADRFDADAWAEHLGPNGHCNARGYAVMAALIDDHLARLDASP